jgi:hypothetical protein
MPHSVNKIISEAMGAAKDVKAGFKGLSGVFMHLMEEHGKVGALIKRVARSDDEAVRSELYPTIRRELRAHETGELKVVYPALAEFAETSAIAAAHATEASELDLRIAEVDALAYGDPGWGPAFERLAELVEEHVDREESEFFPKGQKVLGSERAEELLPRFEAAKSAF